MKYVQWSQLLDNVACLIGRVKFKGKVEINHKWLPEFENYYFDKPDSGALEIDILFKESGKLLISYLVIPWQSFSIEHAAKSNFSISEKYQLVTVSEFDVIYSTLPQADLSEIENETAREFDSFFRGAFNYEENQTPELDEVLRIPDDVQIISINSYNYYIDVDIAIPGSKLPTLERWSEVTEFKMLHLKLVPDAGDVKENWIRPASGITLLTPDVENELRDIFKAALKGSCEKPVHRKELFNRALNSLGDLFSIDDGQDQFYYNKYKARLERWLLIDED